MKLNNLLLVIAISLILFSLLINGLVFLGSEWKQEEEKVTGGVTQGQVSLCVDVGPVPTLDAIGDLYASEGVRFNYTLNGTSPVNETVYYYDNAAFFDVNKTIGEIDFTPTSSDVGSHSVRFWATHDVCADRFSEETITFTVIGTSTPAPPSEGGGGGSGGGRARTVPKDHIKQAFWDQIKKGETIIMEIKDKEIGIERIKFKVNKNLKNVGLKVTRLDKNNLDGPLKEKAHRFFEINAENLKKEDLTLFTIEFTVHKELLAEYDSEETLLLEYNEKFVGWLPLTVEKISEDKDYIYFEGKAGNYFNYFVVIVKPICQEKWYCNLWSSCIPVSETQGELKEILLSECLKDGIKEKKCGFRYRSCKDLSDCGTEDLKPSERISCDVFEEGSLEEFKPYGGCDKICTLKDLTSCPLDCWQLLLVLLALLILIVGIIISLTIKFPNSKQEKKNIKELKHYLLLARKKSKKDKKHAKEILKKAKKVYGKLDFENRKKFKEKIKKLDKDL